MNKTYVNTLAVLMLVASNLSGQIMLKANDPSIRYDWIQPGHYFRKVTGFDSLKNITYELVNECFVSRDNAKNEWVFKRFRQFPFGKQFFDSSVTSSSGPLNYFMSTSPLSKKLSSKFNATTIETVSTHNGKDSMVITPMNAGYFDDNIIEELIGLIPFKKGVVYHADAFRFESKLCINPYNIEYLFDDVLHLSPGKPMHCAVLRMVNTYSETYVWIDKQSHANVKEVIQNKNSHILVQLL